MRTITFVIIPPAVSRPSDNGVTSNNNTSFALSSPSTLPDKIAAWTHAPYATASSGLILLLSSLPLKKSLNNCCIFGIRVDPPTKTTSSTFDFETPASFKTFITGSIHLLNKNIHNDSNFARVILLKKSIPSQRESISILAVFPLDNVRFAFSQLVLSLRNDRLLSVISILFFLLNS